MNTWINFTDNLSVIILDHYVNNPVLKYHQPILGIIALIISGLTVFSQNVMELSERVVLGVFLFVFGITNSLPIFLFIYLSMRNSQKESELLNDKDFLVRMEKKIYADKNLEVTNQEYEIFVKIAMQKYYRKEKLTDLQYVMCLSNNDEIFDNFLFHSTDEDFLKILKIYKRFIPKEELMNFSQLLAKKVPTRFNRIGEKILGELLKSELPTNSSSDIKSMILGRK